MVSALVSLTDVSIAQKKSTKINKPATASNLSDNKFELGVAGGLNLNRFTKGQPHTGYNTGFNGGILANYYVYKNFALQLEVNYMQQGGQMITFKDDTRLGLPESFTTKNVKNSSYQLNSIEVPLLLNYRIKLKQGWQPSIYAGGSYAYTLNVTEHYQKTGNLLPEEDIIATVTGNQGATSLFTSNRFNLIAGANVKLPLSSKLKLLIDFRYLNGLSPVRENYSYMEKTGFGNNIRTNSFISRVGVVMSIK
ncbi:porin family protein [Mucilaginibacter lacusdianchii]|uniref:porin family protein n=1 Tax=Mucilaginibacter lacusdianchii TaxID=2684211 RepID=UPI001E58B06A|nr:porin family protein [Mucilaginibacter sp. JXJ CY 39]